MKLRLIITISGLVFLCDTVEADAAVVSLYGDIDGFGQGIPIADGISYVGNGGTFSDHRDAGDLANAPNTDIWDHGYPLTWTHNYAAPGATSADLEFYISGFADIGSVELFVGNTILTTYDFPPPNTTTHLLNVAVPLSEIDGSTTFSFQNGNSGDGRILDYAKLTINQIPEPSTLLLATLSSVGLVGSRRRKT